MEDQYNEIESYLMGQMDIVARRSFEQSIQHNPALAAAVEAQRLEHDAMDLMLEHDLRHKMEQWSADAPTSQAPTSTTNSIITPAMIGLSALILVLFGLFFWLKKTGPQNLPEEQKTQPTMQAIQDTLPAAVADIPAKSQNSIQDNITDTRSPKPATDRRALALVQQVYTDADIRTMIRGVGGDLLQDSFQLVARAYQQNQYDQVLELTQYWPVKSKQYLSAIELRGHAYFQKKQYAKAAQYFEVLAASEKAPFAERGEWNLMLSYAATLPNTRVNFEKIRQKISNDREHTYYDQAQQFKAL